MILYVNGDSHSAGAEAVNDYCFAQDDSLYYDLGRLPHPDNEKASYGCLVANQLFAVLHCDAESASSNDRIIRTTREYIKQGKPNAVIIGWSTHERQEWLHHNTYWQINAGGVGEDWPELVKEKYKFYIANIDWIMCEQQEHEKIWQFHKELQEQEIPHLFFNSFSNFRHIPLQDREDWEDCFIEPYNPDMTYYNYLKDQGLTALPSYHYRADGHRKWAEYLMPHLTKLL
jgi:hypothetical protein